MGTERIHITRVSARNFKKLRHLELTPEGDVTVFAGDSGQGKSSVLQAVRAALNGADPEVISKGSDEATVFLQLGDGSTIERVIRASGDDALLVTQAGKHLEKQQAKAFLKALTGQGIFDPVRWVQLGGGEKAGRTERRREQRDQLLRAIPMKVTPEDVIEAIQELGEDSASMMRLINMPDQLFSESAPHGLVVCEELRRIAYDVRTMVNRDLATADEDLKRTPAPQPPVPDDSLEEILKAEADYQQQYQRALGALDAREATVQRAKSLRLKVDGEEAELAAAVMPNIDGLNDSLNAQQEIIDKLNAQMDGIRKQIHEAEQVQGQLKSRKSQMIEEVQRITTLQRTLESDRLELSQITDSLGGQSIDPNPLRETLDEIRSLRIKREAQDAHESAAERFLSKSRESDALTKIVELFRDDLPKRVLARANLPIPGLGLDGETLTIDGIPLHQKGTSEQIRIGVRIASLLNPQAGFICVDGIESVGREDRQALYEACQEFGIQILATEVDPDAVPGSGRFVIQDGRAVA